MRKINKILIFIAILPYLFSSCKDDPVTPRPDNSFDSARFEWDIDTLHNVIKGIWAEDTLNIFILVGDGFLDYDGENYSYINFGNNLNIFAIDGYDRFNVYFGGNYFTPSNQYWPKFIKWNGATAQDIVVPDTSNRKNYTLRAIHLRSLNEIWLGGDSGKIIKYDGFSNFTFYSVDSSFRILYLFSDESKNLYSMAYKDSFNVSHTESKQWVDIYKFDENSWTKVYSKIYFNESAILPEQIGESIFGYDHRNIYKFDMNDFSKIIEFHPNMIILSDIDGSSITDIFLGGTLYPRPNDYNFYAFH